MITRDKYYRVGEEIWKYPSFTRDAGVSITHASSSSLVRRQEERMRSAVMLADPVSWTSTDEA